jgi:nucleotide-binding universal stress UspA family protein
MTAPPIVVLTDFYAVSNRALSYAAGLAVPLQAHLLLLHVPHDELLAPPELEKAAHRSPRRLRQALNALADAQPVPTQIDVEEGYLPTVVAEVVRQHQPQLLVLNRPADEVTPPAVVVGAVQDVLRHAACPLLVVPHVGWGAFPPRRLALAVDGEPFSLPESQHLVPELLRVLGGSLRVLHATTEPATEADELRQRLLREVQRSGLLEPATDCQAHLVPQADAAAGILQGAADVEADLLVLVARHHSALSHLFHRSVTAQLIGQSPLPVLLLPAVD